MYHYYVRYSAYNRRNKKIGEGSGRVTVCQAISEYSHIQKIAETLKEVHKSDCKKIERIEIDFYQLLRKDPD